jgi:hypothetical protein
MLTHLDRTTQPVGGTVRFQFWKKIFQESQMQTSIDYAKIGVRYRYLTKAWGTGGPPLGARQNAHHLRGWPRPISATRL